jgi:hypothetical protein
MGLMRGDQEPSWWAIVGPVGTHPARGVITSVRDRFRTIDGDYSVGPLRLSAGERLVEYVRGEPHKLDGITALESHPIIVFGNGPADRFAPEPFRLLHRLSCLLSIAWDEPWQLRSAPEDLSGRPARVPDSWPSPLPWWTHEDPTFEADAVPLPPIVITGWPVLDDDRSLSKVMTMWHEAVLLHQGHPTMACIAYCSVLEALRFIPGAAGGRNEAFKSNLAAYGSADDIATISKLFSYKRRSESLHAAKLFADEDAFGRLIEFTTDMRMVSKDGPPGVAVLATSALRRVTTSALRAQLEGD